MSEVLLAGESWVSVGFEIKGRNVLSDSEYGEAADRFIETLDSVGASVTYQPCHVAVEAFPRTHEELDAYDLVLLSDVGADSLQLTRRVRDGESDVDRCTLLNEWVHDGGALGMVGGYMSFSGKGGQARYGTTALAETLPVKLGTSDDRIETPAGAVPETGAALAKDLPQEWPAVLGYNRFAAKSDAEVWATIGDDPLLVVGDHGDGSAFAYATDCAPHWAPEELLEWEHLPTVWSRLLDRVV